ncbi:MAG: hypothetical protein HY445_02805 [Candidatus Niyogibacteria bacterium]|nr:hypothetical protein [Candidatus Niyogibacteria bacterium]
MVEWAYKEMLVIDTLFGFLFTRFMAGKKSGQRGRVPSVRFRIKDKYTIHLHHWFLCSIALVGMYLIDISSTFLHGLVYGSIVQGFLYPDFYKFIHRQKDVGSTDSQKI